VWGRGYVLRDADPVEGDIPQVAVA
jgi:hypothetical protein